MKSSLIHVNCIVCNIRTFCLYDSFSIEFSLSESTIALESFPIGWRLKILDYVTNKEVGPGITEPDVVTKKCNYRVWFTIESTDIIY